MELNFRELRKKLHRDARGYPQRFFIWDITPREAAELLDLAEKGYKKIDVKDIPESR